jgi:Tfp pilus assembly protein PilV
MRNSRSASGFTLIETLITALVLVSGLVAAAQVFSYTVRTNINNQQRSIATTLLVEKLEEFKSADWTDPIWRVGGSLDPNSWLTGFHDYVAIENDGTLRVNATSANAQYCRVWKVEGAGLRSVTVIVYSLSAGLTHRPMELARAASALSSSF